MQHTAAKMVRSIISDSIVICNEIIEETETAPTKSTSTKMGPTRSASTKTILARSTSTKTVLANFCILKVSLLSTIALILIAISIFLMKNHSKQKHVVPYYNSSN